MRVEAGSAAAARERPAAAVVALAMVLLSLLPLAAIVSGAAGGGDRAPGILAALAAGLAERRTQRALFFSLAQALASTAFALAVGLPGAWLVARYRFPGRRLLKSLSAVPFAFPPLLVVLAFVLYYGRSGLLNRAAMAAFGLASPPVDFLYSFWGIVLVHGFYNFPIALHLVGEVLGGIDDGREEAARLLGAGRLRAFAAGTLPHLLPAIMESAALSFLFCFFSFAVVLVFGSLAGSTLEVEVYRRARIEGDPLGASVAALAETLVAMLVVLLMTAAERGRIGRRPLRSPRALAEPGKGAKAAILAYTLFLGLFFVGPLAALAGEAFSVRGDGSGWPFGLEALKFLLGGPDPPLLRSVLDTASTAIPAAAIATLAGTGAAFGLRGSERAGRLAASLPLAISGIVTAFGWALIVPAGGRGLVVLAQSMAALPFATKTVSSALAALDRGPAESARLLGASPLGAAVDVEIPAILPSIGAAAAFAFAIAAGDVSAPLVLGGGDFEPVPLLLYRLASSYRFSEAGVAGLALGLLTAVVFFVKDGRDPGMGRTGKRRRVRTR